MAVVRIARDWRLDNPGAFGGAVAALETLWGRAIELHKLRIIDLAAECGIDRVEVRLVSVRRDLNAGNKARRKIDNELVGCAAVTPADVPAWDQLRVGVRREPKPSVASVSLGALHAGNVLLLDRDEAPDFIDLEALAVEALENAVLIPSRRLSRVHNELADGRLADAGQSRDCADAHALAKEMEDFGAFGFVQPVHAGHYA